MHRERHCDYRGSIETCMTRNLSHGGMFVLLKHEIAEGSDVDFRLCMKDTV
ncbi:MAG: PilZ domain-containing protein [Myxococcota bacterium]